MNTVPSPAPSTRRARDQARHPQRQQVHEAAERDQDRAEQDGRLAAAVVGEPPGERAQQQAGDRVGADHHPDRDVAGVERAVHEARQDRQHGADRDQAAEGDGEDAGEGDPGARHRAAALLGRGAHRSSPERSSMTWSGAGSAASRLARASWRR